MLEFDIEAFVAKMDRMGLKLTAVPLADGKYRLNRWRTMDALAHTQQIQDLWACGLKPSERANKIKGLDVFPRLADLN
jgi:hypothetical protein